MPRRIVQRYCSQLPADVTQATNLLETLLLNADETGGALKQLHMEVHRMSGAANCMGFPALGQELSSVETILSGYIEENRVVTRALLEKVAAKLEAIARLMGGVLPDNSLLLHKAEVIPASMQQAPRSTKADLRKLMAKQRILFADDDRAIRMLMREILISIGISQVEVVASGAELLKVAPLFDPTIIITDWHMEPVNGLEYLKRVRSGQAEIARNTPVVFLTSQKTVAKVQEVIGEGADHFLVKPFTQNLVERAICQVAEKKMKNDAYLAEA
jgi:CheY-like chemotaxis protein/HPt (histidine-containing phosphotransfer) domain-containing protein